LAILLNDSGINSNINLISLISSKLIKNKILLSNKLFIVFFSSFVNVLIIKIADL
jgi:hypothetical protein